MGAFVFLLVAVFLSISTSMVSAQGSGTIIIQKDGEGTGFAFTSNITGYESFTLDAGENVTIPGLPVDKYRVTEEDPGPLYELTLMWATAADVGSTTLDLASRTAVLDLKEDDTIIATFLNAERAGTIVIKKEGEGTGFAFTSNITGYESFALDAGENLTISDVPVDKYRVTEEDPGPLYELTHIIATASDVGSTILDLASRTAILDLKDDDTITAVFNNVERAGTIVIQKDGEGTGFAFTSNITGYETFTLDAGENVTIPGLPVDKYRVTEEDPGPLYGLTMIWATASNLGSTTLDLPSRTAVLDLKDNDTIIATFHNEILNQPPEITIDNETVTVDEGQIATNSGTWGDPDWVEVGSPSPYPYSWMDSLGNLFTVDASIGDIVIGNRTWDWSYQTMDGPDDSQLVTVSAIDEYGFTDTDNFTLIVNNVAPVVSPITLNPTIVAVGTEVNPIASFTDPGVLDTHIAVWDWGDGSSTDLVDPATSPVSGSHVYTEVGNYTITLTVTDDDGGSGSATIDVIVIEPFVTGGGNVKEESSNKKGKSVEKVTYSFAGMVGVDGEGGATGQFQIIDHQSKISYHSTGFTEMGFAPPPATTPDSLVGIVYFTGTFRNNKDDSIVTLTVYVWENVTPGEGKKGLDGIAIQEDGGGMWIGSQPQPYMIILEEVSNGNFQVHDVRD